MRIMTFVLLLTILLATHAGAERKPVPNDPVKIGMAVPADMQNSGIYVWLKTVANELERAGLTVRIYPNGSLGGDKERIDQVTLGLLEIDDVGPDEISRHSPTFYGLAEPFVIESYEHLDRFLEQTPFISSVNKELASRGFSLVDYAYTGSMVGLLTRRVPVRSVEDLQKIRLRFLSAPDLRLFDALKVRGVQISWNEVAQALQTGMADGYFNPPSVAIMFGHGSVLDYFTDLRMGPSSRLIVVSNAWLASLNPRQRAAYEAAIRKARQANREWNRDYITKEKAKLERSGIKWIVPSEEQRKEWRKRTANIHSPDWYDPLKSARVLQWVEQTRKDPHHD